ncbi:MAG: hypothetical protein A3A96_03515 [Candidatus Zambryskibacteria bacterium RIFCSPLOWO2_01_FULL_39_39]|uniref:Uncharacterized protein n=1 Tax=Candidatus Zambryskibacteria bacterium RIFCSPLOWO2_01_FULL_39_39 TaxID=1802758 RepID=A0A1G2TY33_9BACT|nr:MAG: hypothetical protein A2644_00775 [Candidatus Zambryskibacteria bacterium RIFCSPHIGHO2_01_FULL_39_63]OHA95141.1 MAG: hypothetical protein A3B88_02805 [Candidatus Zambryskibacteria bacterium RIFCSPHIGHO2_02_FULL_39_19]OHA98647.1 MAG: hypothetical protein A3F20_00125 [Candidatus Zambryskibacteria bacterium RIFCSPHIGHO2_12_FULL_39_21]OHB02049.1 MAG: hypothetical protein A3A96_03515 [Candidatus Zambryskibacteria bacterium RIFCSPLOWO2_01_FULL_39_39]
MSSMTFKIKQAEPKSKNVTISFDAQKFERIAGNFGFFNQDFLESLNRAEKDIKAGRVQKIKSLAFLRK